MSQHILPSQIAAVLGTIDPDNTTISQTVYSDWCDFTEFGAMMGVVMLGTFDTTSLTGTVDVCWEQATDSTGGGGTDITSSSITQLTGPKGTDDDKQVVLNLLPSDLSTTAAFTHVRLQVDFATDLVDVAALVIGLLPKYGPTSDLDLSTVDEIANVG